VTARARVTIPQRAITELAASQPDSAEAPDIPVRTPRHRDCLYSLPMKMGRDRIVRGAVACTALLVMLGWAASRAAEIDAPAPSQPPVLAPIAPRPQRADAVLPIEVRITHPAGVGRAVLWFLGEQDSVFRPYPMRRLEGDVFTARLGVWKSRGHEVRYYVEAWDASEAQHAALGDRTAPFVVRLEKVPATTGSAGSASSALWLAILGTALLGALWCGVRVRRRLPPPAPAPQPVRAPDVVAVGPRITPVLIRAAGSVPAETVYLDLDDPTGAVEQGLARSLAALRRLPGHGPASRKSRLAYRRRPEDE
jgi:hypothetical protein